MSKRPVPTVQPTYTPPMPATPPPGAWWNNISRTWLVSSDAGPVPCDPQPPPPRLPDGAVTVGGLPAVPPSLKVSA